MSHEHEKRTWRQRLGWLASELVVVFAGVTAAFVVENYRENRNQIAEMHQAVAGIISELTNARAERASANLRATRAVPILFNEGDLFDFEKPFNNLICCACVTAFDKLVPTRFSTKTAVIQS
jgi:hypothetical protein